MKIILYLFLGIVLLGFSMAGILPVANYSSDQIASPSPFNPADLDTHATNAQNNLQINAFGFSERPVCRAGGKLAVNFLIDGSGSMQQNNRLENLKKLIKNISEKIPPDSVVGGQIYGEPTRELIPYDLFEKNKSNLNQAINKLDPQKDVGTQTFNGFKMASEKIDQALIKYPDYNWKLIHITDGCPNKNQDPTNAPNYPEMIRKKGVNITTIGVDIGMAGKCKNYGGKPGAIKLMQSISNLYIDAESSDLPKKSDEIFKTTNSCPSPSPNLSCTPQQRPAMNLLLDVSGSIEDEMPELKKAIKSFASKLADENIIGVQDFSGGGPRGLIRETVKLDTYSKNKTGFNRAVDSLSADEDGYTYMKDAFEYSKNLISDYKNKNNISKFALIFFSDGRPNTENNADSASQNPTSVADQLKSQGVDIYTISLGNQVDKPLMEKLASDSKKALKADTGAQLEQTFLGLLNQVSCK